MHRDFRSLLENAIGSSEHIIAIMIDIRGFSNFCQRIDSFDIANYLKRLYMKFIDNYFVDASFYKPTGDGLLVISSCPKASLKEIVSTQIQKCLSLLSEFESLCKDDPSARYFYPVLPSVEDLRISDLIAEAKNPETLFSSVEQFSFLIAKVIVNQGKGEIEGNNRFIFT